MIDRNMIMKKLMLPIFASTIWISVSEFVRNDELVKSQWVAHYQTLGLTFPNTASNGLVWGLWSLAFAILIYIILQKFSLLQTIFISWFAAFVLMWLTIGNLGVLPYGILWAAIPLSLLETAIAAWITMRLSK